MAEPAADGRPVQHRHHSSSARICTRSSLKIEITAQATEGVAFRIELLYAGLFALRNVPAEQLQPFLLAEAPRLLFPFARKIIADATVEGGFPPLLLDPIDFAGLYMQSAAQAAGGRDRRPGRGRDGPGLTSPPPRHSSESRNLIAS